MTAERLTPERIAREAAEALVTVGGAPTHTGDLPVSTWHCVYTGVLPGPSFPRREEADAQAGRVRAQVTPAVLAAIERALAVPPLPDGVSAERLGEIRKNHDEGVRRIVGIFKNATPENAWSFMGYAEADRAHLLVHIDHLHAVMRCPEAEAYAAGYDAGRRAGMKEQQESDGTALECLKLLGKFSHVF